LPLGARAWIYTKSVVRLERDEYGVYELLDLNDNVIYIGYGKIKSSLLEHFADGSRPILDAKSFSVEYTWEEPRAISRYKEEIAKYHKKHGKNPIFNLD